MKNRILAGTLLVSLLAATVAAGEDVGAQLKLIQEHLVRLTEKIDTQQKTIEQQQKQIEEQKKMLTQVAQGGGRIAGGPTADVLKRVERAEEQSARAVAIAARKKPNDLNMAIGAAVDTAFRYFDGANEDAGGRGAGNDFQLRTAEMVLHADVDPYFKSYMVLVTHQHEHGGGQAHAHEAEEPELGELSPSLEEAAIYTTSLSHAQVKGGRFFVPFGRLAHIHNHDLPFVTRPGSIDEYVGGESGGDGVQVQAIIPIDHFLQITGGVFNKVGSEFPLENAGPGRRNGAELTYFLKGLTSFNLGDDHTFELGVSTLQVPDHLIRRDLTGLEFTYKWHPAGAQTREKLVWGTELMRNSLRTNFISNLEDVEELEDEPIFARETRVGWGGYTYAEYFHDRHWSFGPRIDIFQNINPGEESERTYEQTYSLFATYRFSEFSRMRAEINRHEFLNGRSANEFYLQWTVFWGAHTHNFDQR